MRDIARTVKRQVRGANTRITAPNIIGNHRYRERRFRRPPIRSERTPITPIVTGSGACGEGRSCWLFTPPLPTDAEANVGGFGLVNIRRIELAPGATPGGRKNAL